MYVELRISEDVELWFVRVEQNLSHGQSPVFVIKTSFFRSSCLWQRGSGSILANRRNLLANLPLRQTLRHPTVMTRYELWLFCMPRSSICQCWWSLNVSASFALIKILTGSNLIIFFFSVQWTVGGTKGKKKVKQGKGSEKKNATKKKFNKATASGSSDGDSSAESSAPEEGTWAWNLPAPRSAYISHKQLALLRTWSAVARHVLWCRLHT